MIRARQGFSLIEALVVLLVAGAALMLVFSVGVRSTETAFRLGRRALDGADRALSTDALRVLIGGLSAAPVGGGGEPGARTPASLTGDPRGLTGDAVLAAATPCAGAGPAAGLTLRVESGAEGDIVTCQIAGGRKAMLVDLRPRRGRFAYSEDGVAWRDTWSPPRETPSRLEPSRARLVYVRLADGGPLEIIARTSSVRPTPQVVRPTTPAL